MYIYIYSCGRAKYITRDVRIILAGHCTATAHTGSPCAYYNNNNNNNNMQFLYSALFWNELKALYILLPPAHLYTPTPSQLLNGAYMYNSDTRYKAPRLINVQ